MTRDIWGHEQRYKRWKEESMQLGIEGLTKKNSDILIKFILDMEVGANVSTKNVRGGRSYPRLNNLRQRLAQMLRMLQERGAKDITKISQDKANKFFSDMRKGIIKTARGEFYRSVADYTKIFNSFWRWYMKVNRKKGITIADITEDLDTREAEKKKFVWIRKEELDKMLPYFEKDEQIVLLFVYDSIIRSPGELLNLKVKDIFKEDGEVWVNIPEDISKTFGRSFNLLFCGDALLKYIERNKLKPDDYLFNLSPPVFTDKIQKVAKQLFGDKLSDTRAGEYYKNMTLYDLRHSGAIFLRIKAKENPKDISLDAIRHRGGWTDFKMLNYYTQLIGMDGKIERQGLMIKEDKTELEKEISALKKEEKLHDERMADLESKYDQLAVLFAIASEPAAKNKRIEKRHIKIAKRMIAKGEFVYPFNARP